MSKDKSNLPSEEEAEESEEDSNEESEEEAESNPSEEEEYEDSSVEDLFDEEEVGSLKEINEETGKDFKDIPAVIKALKQQDKDFVKKGIKQEKEQKEKPTVAKTPQEQSTYDERILKLESPESAFVLDEMKDIAKDTRKSILDIWDDSAYLKKEASARAEASKLKNTNKKKVGAPTGEPTGSGEVSVKGLRLSSKDKEFMRKQGISAKDVAKNIAKTRLENG